MQTYSNLHSSFVVNADIFQLTQQLCCICRHIPTYTVVMLYMQTYSILHSSYVVYADIFQLTQQLCCKCRHIPTYTVVMLYMQTYSNLHSSYVVYADMFQLTQQLCCICRHIPSYIVVMFWKVWCKLKFLEVRIEYAYCHLCMNMKGSPVEIHIPIFLNLISCSMNTCCMCFCPTLCFCQLHLVVL